MFGLGFTIAAIVVFFIGANRGLDDLYVIGGLLLVFGCVLLVLSLVLLCRGYYRAKSANNKVFDTRIPPKRRITKESTIITQSDISVREITPPTSSTQDKRLSDTDLYSDAAIKKTDINKFKQAMDEHHNRENSQSRTVIQLGDVSESQKDDVVIIHDARIALPVPQEQTDNTNASSNTRKAVVFTLSNEANSLPGSPDLTHDSDVTTADIPQAFDYVDPNEQSSSM